LFATDGYFYTRLIVTLELMRLESGVMEQGHIK